MTKAAEMTTATMPTRVRVVKVVRISASILMSTSGPTSRNATIHFGYRNNDEFFIISILKDSKESQILVGSIIALQAFLSSQRQDKEKIILYTKHLDYLEPNLLKAIEEDKEKRLLVLPADQK